MLKFINLKKLTSKTIIGILMTSSLFTMSASANSIPQPKGIKSLDTSTENAPNSTSDMCNRNGNDCNSREFGTGNNIKLNGFKVGSKNYSILKLVDETKFRRVDNSKVSGERHIYFLESGGSGSNSSIKSSEITTMEQAVRSDFINGGTDNVFANSSGVNFNNIERVDFLINDGLFVRSNFVNDAGFLLLERGGNDPFKIAAITDVDADGKPTAFGALINVPKSTWGRSDIKIKTKVIQNDPTWENPKITNEQLGDQHINGVFVSVASLGIGSGQTVYGYALFPNDIDATKDLVNLSDFPTNTNDRSSGGGLDLISSGGLFIPSNASATNVFDEDSDGDGIPNETELGTSGSVPDTDGDGTDDYLDTDSDNDGIPDSVETTVDSDEDGIPDYQDTDSDNDEVEDKVEGTGDPDGDGLPNYLDTDSDGDGVSDGDENKDTDEDGIPDGIEGVTDPDGDGLPNNEDPDSDGDDISDLIEAGSDPVNPVDSDSDGTDDYLDTDSDDDGIPDSVETAADLDEDTIPNYLDTDSDGDGVSDDTEAGSDPVNPVNTDGTDNPDYLDTDSDNDTILDKDEEVGDYNGDGNPDITQKDLPTNGTATIPDVDGDGTPNRLEVDSDDDGQDDEDEKENETTNPYIRDSYYAD